MMNILLCVLVLLVVYVVGQAQLLRNSTAPTQNHCPSAMYSPPSGCTVHEQLLARTGLIKSEAPSAKCEMWYIVANSEESIVIGFEKQNITRHGDWRKSNDSYLDLGLNPCRRIYSNTLTTEPLFRTIDNVAVIMYRHSNDSGIDFQLKYVMEKAQEQCSKVGAFRCSDGQCIASRLQCDGVAECRDKSDEINCAPTVCPQTFTASSGVIQYIFPSSSKSFINQTSETSPTDSDDSIDCDFYIQTTSYSKIQLRFRTFKLPSLGVPVQLEIYTGRAADPDNLIYIYSSGVTGGKHIHPPERIIETPSPSANVYMRFSAGSRVAGRMAFSVVYQRKGECLSDQYQCLGEEDCYYSDYKCDGRWDCKEKGTDEAGCGLCAKDRYSCGSSPGMCYTLSDRCNGVDYCIDSNDELYCTSDKCGWRNGTYLCYNKRCVMEYKVCNGVDDCGDTSDEINCPISTRLIFVTTLTGVGFLLLVVLALGCTCRIQSVRRAAYERLTSAHTRGRHISPITAIQNQIYSELSAPPGYTEAMATSRNYDEVLREQLAAAQTAESSAAAELNTAGSESRIAGVAGDTGVSTAGLIGNSHPARSGINSTTSPNHPSVPLPSYSDVIGRPDRPIGGHGMRRSIEDDGTCRNSGSDGRNTNGEGARRRVRRTQAIGKNERLLVELEPSPVQSRRRGIMGLESNLLQNSENDSVREGGLDLAMGGEDLIDTDIDAKLDFSPSHGQNPAARWEGDVEMRPISSFVQRTGNKMPPSVGSGAMNQFCDISTDSADESMLDISMDIFLDDRNEVMLDKIQHNQDLSSFSSSEGDVGSEIIQGSTEGMLDHCVASNELNQLCDTNHSNG